MSLERCRTDPKIIAFQNFRIRNFLGRGFRALWLACVWAHLGLELCRSGSKVIALRKFHAPKSLGSGSYGALVGM